MCIFSTLCRTPEVELVKDHAGGGRTQPNEGIGTLWVCWTRKVSYGPPLTTFLS